jgi:OOP family OmpA-OmpF porin
LRVQAELDRLLAGGRIDFETGSDRLRPEAAPLLDAVAEQLASAPELEVEVEGHTDSRGNASANRRLSQRRAQTVKGYLVTKGVAAERIFTLGSGSTRPLLRSRTAEASQINRRIEFRVLAPGSR